MPRFYCPQPLSIGDVVDLDALIVRHMQVLRLHPGDQITLFNGEGGEFTASITVLDKRNAAAEVKTFSPREAELPYAVALAQALPEGAKMEWIIEKAVELGATAIQPLATRRSVVKLSGERAERKSAHWQAIIIAAAEQCGRNRLPHLANLADFAQWVAQQDLHQRILLSPRATQSLADWARHHPPQPVSLLIGPEGGLSEQEEAAAIAHGALPLSMGPRVLRTETAALAALAALNAAWGQM